LNSSNSVRPAVLNSSVTCLDAVLSTLFLLILHAYCILLLTSFCLVCIPVRS
jgi:hypothetical protein